MLISLSRSQSKQPDSISLLPIHRYEEEINKRTAAENDFVLLKKVKFLFFYLKGFQKSWRGTLDKGLDCQGKGQWLPTAREQG